MRIEWNKKEGYETKILADAHDLNSVDSEVQLVRFNKGKFSHFHKEKTELFYFLSGSGRVLINRKEHNIKAGSYFLIKPNSRHEFINEKDKPLVAIMFKTNSRPEDTYKN